MMPPDILKKISRTFFGIAIIFDRNRLRVETNGVRVENKISKNWEKMNKIGDITRFFDMCEPCYKNIT